MTVRTRKEPQRPPVARPITSTRSVIKARRQEPAFTGLMAAYYMGAAHYDYQNAYPPRVQPGDVILVHAGLYVERPLPLHERAPRPAICRSARCSTAPTT